MIDFIRCSTASTSMNMLESMGHRVIEPVDKRTMDRIAPLRCKVENIECIQSERAGFSFSGSLHKFFNLLVLGENQNYNDFTFENICEAVGMLEDLLGLQASQTHLHSQEFEVIVGTSIPASDIINDHIVSFNTRSPKSRVRRPDYNLMKFEMTEKELRVYDTALKHKLNDRNLLKIEIKFTKSREIKKILGLNVLTLNDLRQRKTYEVLKRYFLCVFDRLIILDELWPLAIFSAEEKALFELFNNPKLWEKSSSPYTSSQKCRLKRKFLNLVNENNLLQVKNELRSLCENKLSYLVGM